ncbi:hypothetical protein Taro_043433, partial [Colocasia esculenta]|nr:hypothetical protein [Colocasia esculenta]
AAVINHDALDHHRLRLQPARSRPPSFTTPLPATAIIHDTLDHNHLLERHPWLPEPGAMGTELLLVLRWGLMRTCWRGYVLPLAAATPWSDALGRPPAGVPPSDVCSGPALGVQPVPPAAPSLPFAPSSALPAVPATTVGLPWASSMAAPAASSLGAIPSPSMHPAPVPLPATPPSFAQVVLQFIKSLVAYGPTSTDFREPIAFFCLLIMEAITTLRCCEDFSLERLGLLGDFALKFDIRDFSKNEEKLQVLNSDCHFFLPSICHDCFIPKIDRCLNCLNKRWIFSTSICLFPISISYFECVLSYICECEYECTCMDVSVDMHGYESGYLCGYLSGHVDVNEFLPTELLHERILSNPFNPLWACYLGNKWYQSQVLSRRRSHDLKSKDKWQLKDMQKVNSSTDLLYSTVKIIAIGRLGWRPSGTQQQRKLDR